MWIVNSRFSLLLILLCLVASCASPPRLPAVPDTDYLDATIPGMPNVRYFIDGDTSLFLQHGLEVAGQEFT